MEAWKYWFCYQQENSISHCNGIMISAARQKGKQAKGKMKFLLKHPHQHRMLPEGAAHNQGGLPTSVMANSTVFHRWLPCSGHSDLWQVAIKTHHESCRGRIPKEPVAGQTSGKQVSRVSSGSWAKQRSLGSFLPVHLSLAGWSDDSEAIANVA